MLKITNLSKKYKGKENYALDKINLDIKPGEIFGFLGPNGAGKTTTINIMTGIIGYEEGQVSIAGHDLNTDGLNAKKSFGFVPDNHIIYDRLTGREYINFMASIYGVSKEDKDERANNMLKLFELTESYDAQISSYSHGMKQKINIIGALISDPKLWILDEPLTGLDPQSAYQLKELMRAHCEKGNSVFFSTHVLDTAEKICDRIAIIVKGKIVMTGKIDEIRKASKDSSLEDIFLTLTGKVDIVEGKNEQKAEENNATAPTDKA